MVTSGEGINGLVLFYKSSFTHSLIGLCCSKLSTLSHVFCDVLLSALVCEESSIVDKVANKITIDESLVVFIASPELF
jgi:hypothetical protein